MTDRIKEQLSAFLDGELPETESALLVKRLERDDELRGALSRYSLIGAVLRNDGDTPAARQVAARVSAAIAREPARSAAIARLPRRDALMRSAAGLAVAAAVAFGSVLLVQQVGTPDAAAPAPLIAEVAEAPIVPIAPVAGESDTPAMPYVTPAAGNSPRGLPQAQLANYLVAHYGYASPLVRRSVVAGLISAPEETLPAENAGELARTGP